MTVLFPLWRSGVAERSELVRLRAELAEQRAQVAERDRVIVGLSDRVTALVECTAGLAEQNRVLAERVAELERRLGQNLRASNKPPSSEGYEKLPPRSQRGGGGRGRPAARCPRWQHRTR